MAAQYISGDTMKAHGSHIAGYEALLDLRSRSTDHESQEYALDLSVATQIVSHMLPGLLGPCLPTLSHVSTAV